MITYSIIIPIFNASKWIDKCLISILNQNNDDFELILIDDGSTDSSGIICDEYANKDKRIKVFHTPNKGVSAARNLGILNAKGYWLTFIDADDYIEQDYLPTEYNKTADLLIQKWEHINRKMLEDFPSKGFYKGWRYKTYLKKNLHKHIFKVPWGKFFKNVIISEYSIKFNENFKLGEDTLFVLKYLHHSSSIDVISSSTYKYYSDFNPNKYKQTTEKTISYLIIFYNLYCTLKISNRKYLYSVFKYLEKKTIIAGSEINKTWYNNDIVIKINKELNKRTFSENITLSINKLYKFYTRHIKVHFSKKHNNNLL